MGLQRFISVVAFFCIAPAAVGQSATATTLAITSGAAPISTITQGNVVTLTATLKLASGSAALPPGQVNFCEVQAPPLRCTDIRLLGTAQLSSAGTATLSFFPGPGIHTYQAVFLGTHLQAASSSAGSQLTVMPSPSPTATTIASGGVPGNYTLASTVTNFAPTPITGTVSFKDVGNSNYVLATAPLVPITAPGFSLVAGPQIVISPTCSEAIAVADFNNDGKPDIVASNCPNPTSYHPFLNLLVLLGNGNATFRDAPSPSLITGSSQSLAVADFNQDGNQDVAAAMLYTNAVQIMLGNGDGTFTSRQVIPVPSPQAIVSADFNGDGIPDLAVTNVSNSGTAPAINAVTILLGNGDGTFTVGSTIPTGNNPYSIVAGDFTGNGKIDLAITNKADNTVTVLLGNGDGTFTSASSPATGPQPWSIAAADFNRDGILDLAVLNENASTPPAPGSVTILLGNGNGAFTTVGATPATGLTPVSIAVGDFNGDGKADLSVANSAIPPPPGLPTASILLGNGDGTFAPAIDTPAAMEGAVPFAVATSDFNGSGVSDVAVGVFDGFIGTILPQFGTEAAATTAGGISPIGYGPQAVDAVYSGDSNNLPSTSSVIYLTAKPAPTTLTLTLNPAGASYSYGQQVVLTVAINPDPAQDWVPTGTLTISYQGVGTGIVLLGTGFTFTFNIIAQPVGTFPITATYSGDTNFAPATGSLSITVKPALTAATLTSSLNPANAGQTVTFTATVTGASYSGVPPAGSVSFSDGTTVLGTVPLVSGSSGTSTAAFSTSTLTVGTHSITANYIPAAGYAASAATLTQAINPAPVDFTITLASPTVTLQTYQNSTTTVTLASLGGFA
ncbi:MAG: FG-GAP-like repeat-containing protein, partial [Acidobacteriaceae bacterium]